METTNNSKNSLLSNQVQKILFKKGYSFLFTWDEFQEYKEKTKKTIFPAHEIAELFIKNSFQLSDFNDYHF